MPSVQDILTSKGSLVHTVSPSATVLDAIHLMNERRIGALVVTAADRILGIFTERDVLRRVVGKELAPSAVTVQQVMTTEVLCCPPETDLDDAARIMRDRRIRHLPVATKDGQLLGLVSIGDINAQYASAQEAQIQFLRDYVFGRA